MHIAAGHNARAVFFYQRLAQRVRLVRLDVPQNGAMSNA
jgi:hypothetical protein